MKHIKCKILFLYLLCLVVFSSCLETIDNDNSNKLEYISSRVELELAHYDSRYGEFGGNTYMIKIYREDNINNQNLLLADLIEIEGSPEPPPPPEPETHVEIQKGWIVEKSKLKRKNSIPLNDDDLLLIEESIIDLAKEKLKNESMPFHASKWSHVILSDSSLIIEDYSLFCWDKFQILKNNLKNKS